MAHFDSSLIYCSQHRYIDTATVQQNTDTASSDAPTGQPTATESGVDKSDSNGKNKRTIVTAISTPTGTVTGVVEDVDGGSYIAPVLIRENKVEYMLYVPYLPYVHLVRRYTTPISVRHVLICTFCWKRRAVRITTYKTVSLCILRDQPILLL